MKTKSTNPIPANSSWIAATLYRAGVLYIYKKDGGVMVYGGVPSWLHGLLRAGRSIGRQYNKLVKGQYGYLPVPAYVQGVA